MKLPPQLILLSLLLFSPLLLCAKSVTTNDYPPALGELEQQRINQIATMLTDQPNGIGESKPISDRAYWTDPKQIAELHNHIGQAEKLFGKTFPTWNEADYLDFKRTGDSSRAIKMRQERQVWLPDLVYAECLENKGRFIPVINMVLSEYAKIPSWSMHNEELTASFHGPYYVELGSASVGLNLAETLYLLVDKIDPKVRELMLQKIDQRVFDPVRRTIATGKPCWWLTKGLGNWNPVCLSGAVCTALCVIPDKETRAFWIALGEHYSRTYLASFTPDGYCTEGRHYWDYGFGHYVLLREGILHATDGNIDLFADPSVVPDILYAIRLRIGPSAVPPFGDCDFGLKPDANLLSYCNESLGLGLHLPPFTHPFGFAGSLIAVPPTPCAAPSKTSEDPLRFYFNNVGVLCCRPTSEGGLGIGIKAGGNFSHSHNDVGSYEIAIGDDLPTGDPGSPKYYEQGKNGYFSGTPESFLKYKIKGSYGHPLPVIGGQQQLDATKVHPTVLSTSFTPEMDKMVIDMKPTYAVPALQKLTRTMEYDRKGAGNITITDEATFSSPTSFEDALITHGTWKQVDPNTIEFSIGKARLTTSINASAPFSVKPETITELGVTFTRIGLVFTQPCLNARLAVTFTSAH